MVATVTRFAFPTRTSLAEIGSFRARCRQLVVRCMKICMSCSALQIIAAVESWGEAHAARARVVADVYAKRNACKVCVESENYVGRSTDDGGHVECMAFRLLRVKDLDKWVCRRVNI